MGWLARPAHGATPAHWGAVGVEGEFGAGTASGRGGRASVRVGGSAEAGSRAENRGGHIPIGPPTAILADWVLCGWRSPQPQEKSKTGIILF